MLPEVVEYVHERPADLARRSEESRVISVAPHTSATTEGSIHRLGDADGESLDAACEQHLAFRLGDEVEMVCLDAEGHDPKARRARGPERRPQDGQQSLVPEGRDVDASPQRHVGRASTVMWRAPCVRYRSASGGGLAPGPVPCPAPGPRPELELS